ncbi:hypothetical protein BPO_2340 [Bergeyella porcorum]|uniref:Lipoprotein n=1 Tax=Bergeyella porcorum TaxID=1735111 RepID=A0AAU0F3L0_9FLAO
MKKSVLIALSFMAGMLLLSCQSRKPNTQANMNESNKKQADTAKTSIKDQSELLKEYFKKKRPSREELMKMAKEKGIPYRKEENGKVYELQGFDGRGMPIYYTTFSAKEEIILPKEEKIEVKK